jgi:hypothetical protein
MNREIYRRLVYECRCDERPKVKSEIFTRLSYTGLRGELEQLKVETSLITSDERFVSVMGECVIVTLKMCRLYGERGAAEVEQSTGRFRKML